MAGDNHIKVIDLTKSFYPTDPNAVGKNLQWTGKEDDPVNASVCIPYEGYNFLPTAYGYRSYFGTDAQLDAEALPDPNCDAVLLFQTTELENVLIALTASGIYTLQGDGELWYQAVTLTDHYTSDEEYREYTWTILDNDLYIYRQGSTPTLTSVTAVAGVNADFKYFECWIASLSAGGVPSAVSNSFVVATNANFTLKYLWDKVDALTQYRLYWKDTTTKITYYKDFAWNVNGVTITLATYDDTLLKFPDISDPESGLYITATTVTPSFLNMAGQMGLFRANGRLGFWDSANSVSWSSAEDYSDFTPSIENLVGNTQFLGVQGRIVTILAHGEGFIIYSTKSIVGVSYNETGSNLWDAMLLTEAGGIAYAKCVCLGATSKEHYVFSSTGLYRIGHFNALSRQYDLKPVLPDIYDMLKESRNPVFLTMHMGRYLHFQLLDPNYINGFTSFTTVKTETDITIANGEVKGYVLVWPLSKTSEKVMFEVPGDGTYYVNNRGASLAVGLEESYFPAVTNTKVLFAIDGETGFKDVSTFKKRAENGIPGNPNDTLYQYSRNTQIVPWGKYALLDTQSAETAYIHIHNVFAASIFNGDWIWDYYQYLDYAEITGDVPDDLESTAWGSYLTYAGGALVNLKALVTNVGPLIDDLGIKAQVLWNTLQNGTTYAPINIAEWNHIKFKKVGTTISFIVNDTLVENFTVGTIASTVNGLKISSAAQSSNMRFKDFRFTAAYTHPTGAEEDPGISTFIPKAVLETGKTITHTFSTGLEITLSETSQLSTDLLDLPGNYFTLQQGSPAPAYPTLEGSLVLDTFLQKWGKNKNACKALIQLASMNETQAGAIPYSNFGADSGMLTSDGYLKLFTTTPNDGFIRYGKIGFYREGWTTTARLILFFRFAFTGTIRLDGSSDGRDLDSAITYSEDFDEVTVADIPLSKSAKWFTISISGNYDLTNIEFIGRIAGKR
jgi:hypothetical protein